MAIRTYVINIGIDDADGEVKHVTFNAPGEPPIVWNAGSKDVAGYREAWPTGYGVTNPPPGHQTDPLFNTAQVLPIEVYTRNPRCVRVGGWLYCP